MSLALRLGKTLAELMETMTASEMRLWLAYNLKSPIGDTRADYHAASIVSAVYGAQGTKVKLENAILKWGESEPVEKTGLELFLEGL